MQQVLALLQMSTTAHLSAWNGRSALPFERTRCLWMRDTPLALSAAFIDAAGRIVEFKDLSAGSNNIRRSGQPARYVLEMQAGWFADAGVGIGDVVAGHAAGLNEK